MPLQIDLVCFVCDQPGADANVDQTSQPFHRACAKCPACGGMETMFRLVHGLPADMLCLGCGHGWTGRVPTVTAPVPA